jgi:hypothetical protein
VLSICAGPCAGGIADVNTGICHLAVIPFVQFCTAFFHLLFAPTGRAPGVADGALCGGGPISEPQPTDAAGMGAAGHRLFSVSSVFASMGVKQADHQFSRSVSQAWGYSNPLACNHMLVIEALRIYVSVLLHMLLVVFRL